MVWEIVKGAGSAACCLNVICVGHGSDQGGHHLRWVHDGMPAGLLLGQLVNHHGCLVHYHLILVIQELDELRDSPCCKVCVILWKSWENIISIARLSYPPWLWPLKIKALLHMLWKNVWLRYKCLWIVLKCPMLYEEEICLQVMIYKNKIADVALITKEFCITKNMYL